MPGTLRCLLRPGRYRLSLANHNPMRRLFPKHHITPGQTPKRILTPTTQTHPTTTQTCQPNHPLTATTDEPTTSARRHPAPAQAGLSSTTPNAPRTRHQAHTRPTTRGDTRMVHDHGRGHPLLGPPPGPLDEGPGPGLAWLTRPGQSPGRSEQQRRENQG